MTQRSLSYRFFLEKLQHSALKMTDTTNMDIDTQTPSMDPAKRKAPESKSKTIHFTSRNPPWTYFKLKL